MKTEIKLSWKISWISLGRSLKISRQKFHCWGKKAKFPKGILVKWISIQNAIKSFRLNACQTGYQSSSGQVVQVIFHEKTDFSGEFYEHFSDLFSSDFSSIFQRFSAIITLVSDHKTMSHFLFLFFNWFLRPNFISVSNEFHWTTGKSRNLTICRFFFCFCFVIFTICRCICVSWLYFDAPAHSPAIIVEMRTWSFPCLQTLRFKFRWNGGRIGSKELFAIEENSIFSGSSWERLIEWREKLKG